MAGKKIEALVEISSALNELERRARLRWAYRASHRGLVVLVLDGLTPASVNRLLDPIVAETGTSVHGVLFMDREDETGLATLAATAKRVIPVTREFRQRVTS